MAGQRPCPFGSEARPIMKSLSTTVSESQLKRRNREVFTLEWPENAKLVFRSFPSAGQVDSITNGGKDAGGGEAKVQHVTVELTDVPAEAEMYAYGSFAVASSCYDLVRRTKWLQGNGLFFEAKCGGEEEFLIVTGALTLYGPAVSPTSGAPKEPDFSSMRQLVALCDAKLRAGGAVFPVHKVVLGARSPVFLAMFSDNPKPAATKSEVEIPVDCSAAAFGVFLDAVYSGALPDLRADEGQLLHVLELADKYLVEAVRAECLRQLESVDAGSALAVVRAGLEQPFVPEAVTTKAIHAVLDNWWEMTQDADEWKAFGIAHPRAALLLSACRAHRVRE